MPRTPHPNMDPLVRQTLTRLGAAYALAWATTSMGVGAGSAAIVNMTGNLAHAGMYVALFNVSAAAGAALGGRVMDRLGRKPPLIAAYLLATIGYLVAGVAVSRSMLVLFVIGTAMFAMSFGTANLSRLAAAEMFSPAERGRGVAWIQIAATFGAIVGPLLLVLSEPLGRITGRAPMSLVWFLAPPLLIASAFITRSATEPRTLAIPAPPPMPGARSAVAVAATGTIIAGTISLAASQAAMAAVMGVSGAAVAHAGHGVPVLGSIMFLHFIGMFGLSRVVGRLVDKVGRLPTILAGLGLLALGGAIVAVVPGAVGFGVGLLLVGLGWSFGFIGSTVLLTDATAPERRARVLGRADLTGQLTAAALALGSGWWFAARGVAGLGIVAIVVAALPVVLLVRLRRPAAHAQAGVR
jgi:MFS family permease